MILSYKILKLNSGEDIVCKTNEEINLKDNFSIFIKDPMVLNQIRTNYKDAVMESYTLAPWFSLSKEEFYEVPVRNIVSYANANDELRSNYILYIDARKEAENNAIDVSDDVRDSILEEENDENNPNRNYRDKRRKIIH